MDGETDLRGERFIADFEDGQILFDRIRYRLFERNDFDLERAFISWSASFH